MAESAKSPIGSRHFTWIHLSDWHQGRPDYDRHLLLERLLEDIAKRQKLDDRLGSMDLIVFSGDIAFSGQRSEYADTQEQVVDPLRGILGSKTSFLFAPGNHDLDRVRLKEIPSDWEREILSKSPERHKRIGEVLYDKRKEAMVLAPFENFYSFAKNNGCKYEEGKSVLSMRVMRANRIVGIAAVNTAVCCARHRVKSHDVGDAGDWWDYGVLSITERQMRDAVKRVVKRTSEFL